ncbi:MAG: hypothetical protein WC551_09580 [Patescibacteria group bacterium]|jgi:DNA-binding response OmpR family regulator
MIVLLTELEAQQAIDAIANGARLSNGLVQVDLPFGQARAPTKPQFSFNDLSKTVHCDKCSARLSAIQFALLKHVADHGRSSFESLQDAVWHEEISDGAIRSACSKVNARLMKHGFTQELQAHRGHVSLETMC